MADRDQRKPDDNGRHRAWTPDEPVAEAEADPGEPGQSPGGFPSPAQDQGSPDQAAGGAGPGSEQGGGSYALRDFGHGAQRSHFQQDQRHVDLGSATQSYGQPPTGVVSQGPQDQQRRRAVDDPARTPAQETISAPAPDVADGGSQAEVGGVKG